jgi:4-amino-4-deoxy-L-arabinose transferase-like glycosyltransferase
VLLAVGFLLTGGVHTLAVAKLVNCALGGATILIGSLTARMFWGDRAGLFAAFLSAFYPRYILTVCVLASENLFAPLLLCFVLLSILASRSRVSARGAVLGGVVVGLLALTRTVAYFLGLVWLLSAVITRKRFRPVLLELVLLVTVQHAIMLPWAIRNRLAIGRFTFLTTSGGMGLFNGNNPNATGLWYDWGKDLERVSPGITKKNAVEIDDAARKAAIAWMRQHPAQAAKLYFEKLRIIAVQDVEIAGWALFARGVSPPVPGADVLPWRNPFKDHPRAVTLVLRLAAGGIALLGALGFLVLFNRAFRTRAPVDWSIALTFLATAAYVPLVSALIAVNGRYRWPTEDLLIPVAASLLAPATRSMRVSEAIHSRRGPAFLPPESQADGTPGKRQ